MPVRLLRPYQGQALNTVYAKGYTATWTSGVEDVLRATGSADDFVENASDYPTFQQYRLGRQEVGALASLGVNTPGVVAMSTPLSGISTGSGTVGPFKPDIGRGINVMIKGLATAGGQAQVLRSFDGTQGNALPITILGSIVGIYTADIQDIGSFVESETAAAYFLTLPAANITYRLSQ